MELERQRAIMRKRWNGHAPHYTVTRSFRLPVSYDWQRVSESPNEPMPESLRPMRHGYAEGFAPEGRRVVRGTLRMILEATERNRHAERIRIMRAARRIARRRNGKLRAPLETFTPRPPIQCLYEDVRDGLLPRAHEIAVETFRVDRDAHLLGESGATTNRHWLTFRLEAVGYLVQLERLQGDYASRRRVVEATMRDDGANPLGTVRGSRPWKQSRGRTNPQLTRDDLKRASEYAEPSAGIQVVSESRGKPTMIRYFAPFAGTA